MQPGSRWLFRWEAAAAKEEVGAAATVEGGGRALGEKSRYKSKLISLRPRQSIDDADEAKLVPEVEDSEGEKKARGQDFPITSC